MALFHWAQMGGSHRTTCRRYNAGGGIAQGRRKWNASILKSTGSQNTPRTKNTKHHALTDNDAHLAKRQPDVGPRQRRTDTST